MPTLTALIEQKQHLEAQLEDVLTYTEELEQIWENTGLEISKKVDAYGFVIDDIKMKVEYLAEKKRKMTDIKQRLENEIERIKYRLNQHCDGSKLIGNEYKMHPFDSITNTVNMELVEDSYGVYLFPPITYIEKMIIEEILENSINDIEESGDVSAVERLKMLLTKISNANHKVNVTDLPSGHKAIISKITPSVRIT